jgi:hypothetical protein
MACLICGKEGHGITNCPERWNNTQCTICGGKDGNHYVDCNKMVKNWKEARKEFGNEVHEDIEKYYTEEPSTQEKINILFDNFKEFLKEKNKRYGDSALNPLQIFSKIDAGNQICNRIDDKLGRIKKSELLKKNDVSDMFGYIALLLIENNWLEFKDYWIKEK